jgi:hypothetical protein
MSGSNVDVGAWWLVLILLALTVTIGLFFRVNQIAYDTEVWNVAKATDIGYAYDVLNTIDGDATVTVNLDREKTFTLTIEGDKLTIKDNLNSHTYDLTNEIDQPYQERDPKQITFTKIGGVISVA